MKKNVFLYLISIFFLLLVGNSNSKSVYSEETKSNDSVGFNVKAVLPENQLNKENSFFDLRVSPNQEQEIELLITNTSSKEEVYDIAINQAYTNEQATTVSIDLYRTREPNKLPGNVGSIDSLNSNVSANAGEASISNNSFKLFPETGEILNQTIAVSGLLLVLFVYSFVLLIKRKEI